MHGVRELLDTLTAAGVLMAIATSHALWVVPAVERLGLRPTFAAIVTGDEVAPHVARLRRRATFRAQHGPYAAQS
jgi:phosphoglycolate phosphatase-like HAD superfamily hydrolase